MNFNVEIFITLTQIYHRRHNDQNDADRLYQILSFSLLVKQQKPLVSVEQKVSNMTVLSHEFDVFDLLIVPFDQELSVTSFVWNWVFSLFYFYF